MAARLAGWLFQLGFWFPLTVCTYLALVPDPPEHSVFQLSDVVLHAFAFTFLTLAMQLAFHVERFGRQGLYVTFTAMLAYGVLLELVQSLIPERSAELKDLWVDVIGILLGLGLGSVLVPKLRHGMIRIVEQVVP